MKYAYHCTKNVEYRITDLDLIDAPQRSNHQIGSLSSLPSYSPGKHGTTSAMLVIPPFSALRRSVWNSGTNTCSPFPSWLHPSIIQSNKENAIIPPIEALLYRLHCHDFDILSCTSVDDVYATLCTEIVADDVFVSRASSSSLYSPPVSAREAAPVMFDHPQRRRNSRRFWTMNTIISSIQSQSHELSDETFSIMRDKYRYLRASTKHMPRTPRHRPRAGSGTIEVLDIVSRFVLDMLPCQNVNSRITHFQQLLQDCCDAFRDGDMRRQVVSALNRYCIQINGNDEYVFGGGNDTRSDLHRSPVQLFVSSFGFLFRLCKLHLQACLQHEDYLCAYELLRVSSMFYHIVIPTNSIDRTHKRFFIQTLKSRIIHNEIFRPVIVWCAAVDDLLRRPYCTEAIIIDKTQTILREMHNARLEDKVADEFVCHVLETYAVSEDGVLRLKLTFHKLWKISESLVPNSDSEEGSETSSPSPNVSSHALLHLPLPSTTSDVDVFPLETFREELSVISEESSVDLHASPTPVASEPASAASADEPLSLSVNVEDNHPKEIVTTPRKPLRQYSAVPIEVSWYPIQYFIVMLRRRRTTRLQYPLAACLVRGLLRVRQMDI